jgi:outer membrane usher protein FimD/PapC
VDGGEAYVSGLAAHSIARVQWRDLQCTIVLDFPATNDPLPFLGNFVCAKQTH